LATERQRWPATDRRAGDEGAPRRRPPHWRRGRRGGRRIRPLAAPWSSPTATLGGPPLSTECFEREEGQRRRRGWRRKRRCWPRGQSRGGAPRPGSVRSAAAACGCLWMEWEAARDGIGSWGVAGWVVDFICWAGWAEWAPGPRASTRIVLGVFVSCWADTMG
jgi:hypothetical protein